MLNCQYKSYSYLGSRLCAGQERQKVRLEYIISYLGWFLMELYIYFHFFLKKYDL